MWNNLNPSRRRALVLASLLFAAVPAVLLMWPRGITTETARQTEERTRSELDLRAGILYLAGEEKPFNGTLVEHYSRTARKLAIGIREGRPHGPSRGWYENGQLEVEETFLKGVSNGIRIRWYSNGIKKSQATIVDGKLAGRFVRWHDNGQKAAEVQMLGGKSHGLAEAWHPSGNLKSRVHLDHGVPGQREFFPDANPIAQVDEPNSAQ